MGPGEGEALSRVESALEPLMPQHNDLSRFLLALDQASTLIAVIEMSQSSWLVAAIVPGIARHPLKKINPDETILLGLLRRWQDEAAKAGRAITRIAVAYEAGRDGFWLARWLRARGIEAYVIHPTSIPVSREHRRAKTDRLDTELLKRAFLGWRRGEPDHGSMAAIPTLDGEDAKRPSRERETLVSARTRLVNRIKGTLVRLGIRGFTDPPHHAGGGRPAAQYVGRAAPRHGAPALCAGSGQRDRADPDRTARAGSCRGVPGHGVSAGPGDRRWHRDRGHARARGSTQPAGPAGGGALRWPDRLARRERRQTPGEGFGQGGQRPRPPRDDPVSLALSPVPEG